MLNRRNSRWWYVKGNRYNDLKEPAKIFNVCPDTIRNWCLGINYKGVRGKPKENCYAEFKYPKSKGASQ